MKETNLKVEILYESNCVIYHRETLGSKWKDQWLAGVRRK